MDNLRRSFIRIGVPLLLGCRPHSVPEVNQQAEPRTLAEPAKTESSTQLGHVTDEELRIQLNRLLDEQQYNPYKRDGIAYEACLTEIVRRGGGRWESVLVTELESLTSAEFKPFAKADLLVSGKEYNLELLTALRRIQQKPDPLRIFVDAADPLIVDLPELPSLKVRIENVDVDKQDVGFTIGGDYRTGRQARWRIDMIDDEGNVVATRRSHGVMGGGLFSRGTLKHGESWETVLVVRSFLEVPAPGKYSMQILYHDWIQIADGWESDDRFVYRSDTIRVIVNPLTIALSSSARQTAESLIDDLDEDHSLKVVAGTYGAWAFDFVPPESPQGKLLTMGMKAAPVLIESLSDAKHSPRKRASLLSILFSITGVNDPREWKALGAHDYKEGPWQVWGSLSGSPGSGGFGTKKGSVSAAVIDPESQDVLATRWREWLGRIEIREVEKKE